MDSFNVTDEGGGIIRVDAETNLMRKPMAEAICAEVEAVAKRYGSFKILMNLGAISKGTPGAGIYTLREMKKYDMTALALFRANRFMQAMATVVLGLARFRNFAVFTDEAEAVEWLKNADAVPVTQGGRRWRGAAPAVALVGGGLAAGYVGLKRLRASAAPALVLLGGGAAASYAGVRRLRG